MLILYRFLSGFVVFWLLFSVGVQDIRGEIFWRDGQVSNGKLVRFEAERGVLRWLSRDWKSPWDVSLSHFRGVRFGGAKAPDVEEACALAVMADGTWISLREWSKADGVWHFTPLVGESVRLPDRAVAELIMAPAGRAWRLGGVDDFDPWLDLNARPVRFRQTVGDGVDLSDQPIWRAIPLAGDFVQVKLKRRSTISSTLRVVLAPVGLDYPGVPGVAAVELRSGRIDICMVSKSGEVVHRAGEIGQAGEGDKAEGPDPRLGEGDDGGVAAVAKIVENELAIYFDLRNRRVMVEVDGIKEGEWKFEEISEVPSWGALILESTTETTLSTQTLSGFQIGVWDGLDPWARPKGSAIYVVDEGWKQGEIVRWGAGVVEWRGLDGELVETAEGNVLSVKIERKSVRPDGALSVRLEGLGFLALEDVVVADGVLSGSAFEARWQFPLDVPIVLEVPKEDKVMEMSWLELNDGRRAPGKILALNEKEGVVWSSSAEDLGESFPWDEVASIRKVVDTEQRGTQVFLKNGDVLGGELLRMNREGAEIRMGAEVWPVKREVIAGWIPDALSGPRRLDGFSDPGRWIREGEVEAQLLNMRNGLPAASGHPEWVGWRAGDFLFEPTKSKHALGSYRARLSREIMPTGAVEVSFRLSGLSARYLSTGFSVGFLGDHDEPNFLCSFQPFEVSVFIQKPSKEGRVPLLADDEGVLRAPISDPFGMKGQAGGDLFQVRFNRFTGRIQFLRDGIVLGDFSDKSIGVIKSIRRVLLTVVMEDGESRMVRDLVVAPPAAGCRVDGEEVAAAELDFANGDQLVVDEAVFDEGVLRVSSEVGDMKIQGERVARVTIPSVVVEKEKRKGSFVAGVDGTRIWLTELNWDEGVLTGRDGFGEVRRLGWDEVELLLWRRPGVEVPVSSE